MKKYVIILLAIFLARCEQEKERDIGKEVVEIDKDYIRSKLSYFTINNAKIEGAGKKILQKMIKESQFVVFGENHYSKQTSILTKALIPLLAKASYTNFVVEVGPNSANKLKELSTSYENTVEQLKVFNTKYKFKEFGESADPIPFFAGIEDAEFLSEMSKYNMKIIGIDQEYYFSILFLMDELLKEAEEKIGYQKIVEMKVKAEEKICQYFRKEEKKEIKSALEEILKDIDILNFFNQFDKEDTKANKIINDLKLSWDIYMRWRQDSHVDRISYMRNNLYDIYKQNSKAKMFIKIGSLHASRIISNKAYDIGNFTEELAIKNNTISSSINSWRPYYKEKDSITNNLKKYKKYYKRLALFTMFSKKEEWTIIDLKSIRKDIKNQKIKLPTNGDYHSLKKIIEGYDYQLILPVDESITYNLNKKNEK